MLFIIKEKLLKEIHLKEAYLPLGIDDETVGTLLQKHQLILPGVGKRRELIKAFPVLLHVSAKGNVLPVFRARKLDESHLVIIHAGRKNQ